MNSLRTGCLLCACVASFTATLFSQPTAIPSGVIPQLQAVTVTLGYSFGVYYFQAPPPPPPINISPGAQVRLETGCPDSAIVSVVWFKNSLRLPATSKTLEFHSISETDSGFYHAEVTHSAGTLATERAMLRVIAPSRQPLLALASRGTLGAGSPRLIGGFVISPSVTLNEHRVVLIRAVGPSLATLGVSNPLATPKLTLFDRNGVEIPPQAHAQVWPGHDPAQLAAAIGAFPLLPNSADVAVVLSLPGGPYTAHVSSVDGGSGDVLLEIYDVPDSVLQWAPIPVPTGSVSVSPPPPASSVPIDPGASLAPAHPSGAGL